MRYKGPTGSPGTISISPLLPIMALNEAHIPNVYAYRGRHLLSAFNTRNDDVPHHKLSQLTPFLNDPSDPSESPNRPVCIIGAGMAGLYTAMIFESLKISYHIVDADTRERIGGRMFTYKFPNGGPYDYYVRKSPSSFALSSDSRPGHWSYAVP